MKRIQTAMLGTGFMGTVHTENVRRLGYVDVVAVAGSSPAKAAKFAKEHDIERSGTWQELCQDPTIDAVHICTPNVLHFQQAKLALEYGKHVGLGPREVHVDNDDVTPPEILRTEVYWPTAS